MEKVGSNKLTDRYLKDLGPPPRCPGLRGPASPLARWPAGLLAPLGPPSALPLPASMSHACLLRPCFLQCSRHAPPLLALRADKEEDELIQMRRTIARLEEEEANLVIEMSAALLELGTQVPRQI
jgi:hypothetical protein